MDNSALVRWNHPVRGLLLPGASISLAERTEAVPRLYKGLLPWRTTLACCLLVVAEGIKTVVQQNYPVPSDCDLLQGFLYSRPVPLGQFALGLEY